MTQKTSAREDEFFSEGVEIPFLGSVDLEVDDECKEEVAQVCRSFERCFHGLGKAFGRFAKFIESRTGEEETPTA